MDVVYLKVSNIVDQAHLDQIVNAINDLAYVENIEVEE